MRYPAVAGRFYPDDPKDLGDMIGWCFRHPMGPGMPDEIGSDRCISAVMASHAGYVCSGMTAAHSFKAIREDGLPEAYVVIGPDHHGTTGGRNILCSDSYLTPFGECRTDAGICEVLSGSISDVPGAHLFEHSIEVELPFLQYIDPDPRIVPIIMGDQSYEGAVGLASAIKGACSGRDVVIVASTDMSHYIPKGEAARLDGMVLDRIREMDVKGMYRVVRENRVSMCGYGPTAVAMLCSGGCSADNVLHTDSFDSLGMDPSSVVGYASAVFRRDSRIGTGSADE